MSKPIPNLIGRKDLYFCLTSSRINDNIIDTFFSSLITVLYNKVCYSIRLFTDISHNGTFNEVIYSSVQKDKSKSQWYAIQLIKTILLFFFLDSINQWNITKIKTIFHCMVKQFLFHKEKFPKPDWRVVRHVGLQIKNKKKKKQEKKTVMTVGYAQWLISIHYKI